MKRRTRQKRENKRKRLRRDLKQEMMKMN